MITPGDQMPVKYKIEIEDVPANAPRQWEWRIYSAHVGEEFRDPDLTGSRQTGAFALDEAVISLNMLSGIGDAENRPASRELEAWRSMAPYMRFGPR